MKQIVMLFVAAVALMIAGTASAHHEYNVHHESKCGLKMVFPGIFLPVCEQEAPRHHGPDYYKGGWGRRGHHQPREEWRMIPHTHYRDMSEMEHHYYHNGPTYDRDMDRPYHRRSW